MQLGRTHRAQMRFPIHFTAPDKSKTYIGETTDISSNGFSVQVRTEDPLPTIIVAGILASQAAGDAILCKARVVWQGGLAGGIKKASYKLTSISQKSQERLDTLIQESVAGLVAELQRYPLFSKSSREELETLLHLARSRDLPADTMLYEGEVPHGTGVYVILEGEVLPASPTGGTAVFGPGSIVGQWGEPAVVAEPESARTQSAVRFLHLPTSLTQEFEQAAPALGRILRGAVGRPAELPEEDRQQPRRRKMKLNILKELQEIPTLPTIFNAVMDCYEDPEATPRDLAQIIKKDQSLTVKILRTVNSAVYGFSRRISSVDEAVVMLGMNQTANLAVTAMLLNTLSGGPSGSRPEVFWEHALGSAYMAQAIGECLKGKGTVARRYASVGAHRAGGASGAAEAGGSDSAQPASPGEPGRTLSQSGAVIPMDRLFTLAIVHDIGLVALYIKFPEHFAAVQEAIAESGSLHRAELELLEVNHCQLGYRMAQAWRLPEPMPTVIAEHHLPQIWADEMQDHERLLELLREDNLVTLISLADLMARHCGIGLQHDPQPPAIPGAMLEALGLTEADAGEILSEGPMLKEKAELFFAGLAG